ncbi:MAG: mechanosensitive ion channel family protein [Crinalium sp.]
MPNIKKSQPSRPTYRLRRSLLIGLLACLITVVWSTQATSQIPLFGDSTTSNANLPVSNVDRRGALEVTWVQSPLSGKKLFQIASPTVIDRSNLTNYQMPVEVRARNIEDLMWLEFTRLRERAIGQLFDPGTANGKAEVRSAQVVISTLKNLTVLQISNATNSRPQTIVTVTAADSDFYSETPEQLAKQWKEVLQTEIAQAEQIYSPPVFQQRLQQTAAIFLGIVIITCLLVALYWYVHRRQKALRTSIAALAQASTDLVDPDAPALPSPPQAAQTERAITEQSHLERRRNLYKFARWLLIWLIVLVWYIGIYLSTTTLPILMRWSNKVLTQPLNLILIWFLTSFIIQGSHFLIQRSLSAWSEHSYLSFGDAQRKAIRSQTLIGALQGLATCVLLLLGILLTLVQFGLPASSILAGSAVLGLALSFGAQNLVKDLVNGCLILLEDQFAVGDIITTNGESGVVEKLNLRLTQLRNVDGELISIPNSSITLVKNQTSTWSRINLGIDVAYSTDLDHAIAVIDKVAQQLSQDEAWQPFILVPPQVLGVDAFGNNSITIRLWIRTAPRQQWIVGREFRLRLKKAFDHEGISMPFPQRSVWFKNPLTRIEAIAANPNQTGL